MTKRTRWIYFLVAVRLLASGPAEPFAASAIREHIRYLASTELGGRKPGEPGYRMATEYVARCFKEAGLDPAFRDERGAPSFFQPVPLIRYRLGPANSLRLKTSEGVVILPMGGKNYQLASPGTTDVKIPPGPPVFIGYGIHDPEHGWDDYRGLELSGRLAIMMDGVPPDSGSGPKLAPETRRLYAHSVKGPAAKLKTIFERGAAGVLGVPNPAIIAAWRLLELQQRRCDFVPAERYPADQFSEPAGPIVMAYPDLVKRLFAGRGYDPLSHKGTYRTFVLEDLELKLSVDVTREAFVAHNVVGIVRGAVPAMRDQYIVVSAHLDHLGADGNKVLPGANDNASGSAAVLEAARAVAMKPPSRSVILVLFTGEEAGRFGSRHFVAQPSVSKDRILLDINLDQVGVRNPQLPSFYALGPDAIRVALFFVSGKIGLAPPVFEAAESGMKFFRTSDNYSFYSLGIPALLITTGGFPEQHSSGDRLELIDIECVRQASVLAYELAMEEGSR